MEGMPQASDARPRARAWAPRPEVGSWKAWWSRICLRRTLRRCRFCGGGSHLHVHHIDGHHENNDPDNLARLCVRCHRVVTRYYAAADADEFAAVAAEAQRRVASRGTVA